MSRINGLETIQEAIIKMSDGNPGAIVTMTEIIKEPGLIDPQSFSVFAHILSLDTYEIYGTDIYILFNDKCKRNLRDLFMLIRATQLGFLSPERLKMMAHDQCREIDLVDDDDPDKVEQAWIDLDNQVCTELKEFQKGPRIHEPKEPA